MLLLNTIGLAQRRSEALASEVVGFYHWGGQTPRSISEGIRAVERVRGRIARIALSPRYRTDYHAPGAEFCDSQFSLARALADPDLRNALDAPGIEVVLISAYDGLSFPDCLAHWYLIPGFYTRANRAALTEECAEFAFALSRLYAGRGKRFILSNWEGDNAIYCGQAVRYALEEDFRKECNANYPSYYGGNRSPADSIQGVIFWLRARFEGVAEGKRRAADAGLAGVEIESAPEFSVVHALRHNGLASVLYDVIPKVPFDYVSYSAYESINQPDPAARLGSDLDLIRAVAGTSRIILGEVGYARSICGTQAVANLSQVIGRAIAWGVSYVIHWNLYDQDAQSDFGLYDVNGRSTEVAGYFARLLAEEVIARTSRYTAPL